MEAPHGEQWIGRFDSMCYGMSARVDAVLISEITQHD